MLSSTLGDDLALGGDGCTNGLGGGLYVAEGITSVLGTTIDNNEAAGGKGDAGGTGGNGFGGGVYVGDSTVLGDRVQ
jgi:hypothetical protein